MNEKRAWWIMDYAGIIRPRYLKCKCQRISIDEIDDEILVWDYLHEQLWAEHNKLA